MKEIELSGKLRVMCLTAVKQTPDGYKGIDRIRTGLKLLKKFESGLPKEDRKLNKEEEETKLVIALEDSEFSFLKSCVDTLQWNGAVLELLDELYTAFDSAKKV